MDGLAGSWFEKRRASSSTSDMTATRRRRIRAGAAVASRWLELAERRETRRQLPAAIRAAQRAVATLGRLARQNPEHEGVRAGLLEAQERLAALQRRA